MLIAHLSDLHLRDEADAVELDRQLDRIVARNAATTWSSPETCSTAGIRLLLERALDALGERGLLSRANDLTILHGNHDLASSGGHPRAARGSLAAWRCGSGIRRRWCDTGGAVSTTDRGARARASPRAGRS